jgi:two-component system KDP operon response regulator KdpE
MFIDGTVRTQIAQAWNKLSHIANDTDDILEAGEFRLDLRARTVSVRGRELQLSPVEFQVLVFLVSHKKQFVSSRTSLSTKTGDGQISHSEFLPALFSLRKKLQQEVPDGQYLRTETWVLYDFHPAS